MEFYKLSATGNDFILFVNQDISNINISKLCNRNYSIGADGIITINDNKVSIYNADGSKASMCGNGLRCVSKLLSYLNNTSINTIYIENKPYYLKQLDDNNAELIMPTPIMMSYKNGYLVNVSNNHFVFITNDLDKVNFNDYLDIVKDKKANIHAIKIIDRNNIYIKTYEYGVKETLSCGSGSVACFFVLYMLNKVENNLNVISSGGVVNVRNENNNYILKGNVNLVYKGELYGF